MSLSMTYIIVVLLQACCCVRIIRMFHNVLASASNTTVFLQLQNVYGYYSLCRASHFYIRYEKDTYMALLVML